jgi:hypothetical protein
MKKYDKLRAQYPDIISLDQLYRICGISKRSARYLVENKIIPSTDTGKKTWRYHIKLEDVIAYLRKREKVGSMIPCGEASSRKKSARQSRRTYASYIQEGEERAIADYFSFLYSDYPDVLTSIHIVEMTGLSRRTVLQFLKADVIKSLWAQGQYIVPKPYFLDFVQSRRFMEARSLSENYTKILGGFELWKTARS